MKESAIIKELLNKYKLTMPVNESDRGKILRSKEKTLKDVLKGGSRGFAAEVSLALFSMYRKAGINITPSAAVKSTAMAAAAVIFFAFMPFLLTGGIDYKGYFTAEKVEDKKGFVAALAGDVKIGNGEELTAASVKSEIAKGNSIITGENSGIIFRFKPGPVVQLLSSTSVAAEKTGDVISLSMKQGGVFTVKGTEFGVLADDDKTVVFVSRGTVSAEHKPSGKVDEIKEGYSGEISMDMTPREMSSSERDLMDNFHDLIEGKDFDSMSDEEIKILSEKLKAFEPEPAEKKAQKKRLTLEDLKARYGRIDVITLYNGRVIKGVITARGATVSILTEKGKITVQENDIKGTDILR